MSSYSAHTKVNVDLRGKNISKEQRDCVENLRSQVYEVQKRFDLAEQTALILDQMLDPDTGLGDAVHNTYEGIAFARLRYQLFRLVIIDLWACVLDKNKSTASIHAIVKELRSNEFAIDALKNYYADTSYVEVEIEGKGLDASEIERIKSNALDRHSKENIESIDKEWNEICSATAALNNIDAKRMIWARNKVVAHFEKTSDGLVALHGIPPCGNGELTWAEPIHFLNNIRPYVYKVYCLITSTSWDSDFTEVNRFYAKAFWDRFKNGSTKLTPQL